MNIRKVREEKYFFAYLIFGEVEDIDYRKNKVSVNVIYPKFYKKIYAYYPYGLIPKKGDRVLCGAISEGFYIVIQVYERFVRRFLKEGVYYFVNDWGEFLLSDMGILLRSVDLQSFELNRYLHSSILVSPSFYYLSGNVLLLEIGKHLWSEDIQVYLSLISNVSNKEYYNSIISFLKYFGRKDLEIKDNIIYAIGNTYDRLRKKKRVFIFKNYPDNLYNQNEIGEIKVEESEENRIHRKLYVYKDNSEENKVLNYKSILEDGSEEEYSKGEKSYVEGDIKKIIKGVVEYLIGNNLLLKVLKNIKININDKIEMIFNENGDISIKVNNKVNIEVKNNGNISIDNDSAEINIDSSGNIKLKVNSGAGNFVNDLPICPLTGSPHYIQQNVKIEPKI